MEKPLIVCVDDERIVLDSLHDQLFDFFDGDVIIEVAESGEEALAIFQDYFEDTGIVPQVIISDQLMPKMKGDELFSVLNEQYHETIKILLTGQAEKQDVVNAVNHGNLFRYIEKPWKETELVNAVNEALTTYFKRKTDKKDLERYQSQIQRLNERIEKYKNEIEKLTGTQEA